MAPKSNEFGYPKNFQANLGGLGSSTYSYLCITTCNLLTLFEYCLAYTVENPSQKDYIGHFY